MQFDKSQYKDTGARLVRGAVAGVAGTLVMKAVSSLLGGVQDDESKELFKKEKPTEKAVVDKASSVMGWKPSRSKRAAAARGVKWALGAGTGVLTAWLRRKTGATDSLMRGTLFGMATFLLANEVLKPAIGAQKKPTDYPWQTHARALAGHAAYGLTNAGTRRILQRAMSR